MQKTECLCASVKHQTQTVNNPHMTILIFRLIKKIAGTLCHRLLINEFICLHVTEHDVNIYLVTTLHFFCKQNRFKAKNTII